MTGEGKRELWRRAGDFWRWLAEPQETTRDVEQREQARLLASLLVVFLPFGFLAAVLPPLLRANASIWQGNHLLWVAGGVVLWTGVYGLSRTGYSTWATWLAVAGGSLAVFVSTLVEHQSWQQSYLILPLLVSGLLLSWQTTLGLVLAELAGMLLLSLIDRSLDAAQVVHGPLGVVAVAGATILLGIRHRDRLERVRRAALTESEARYRTLFETSFEGIATHNRGVLVDVNPGFARMFGYPPAEIVGTSLLDLIVEEWRAPLSRYLEAKAGGPQEMLGLRRDGTAFRIELLAKSASGSGQTLPVLAVRDISEQLRTKETLWRSVTELQNVQQVLEGLLRGQELPDLTRIVAQGVVDQLGYDLALVSGYLDREEKLIAPALYTLPTPESLGRLGRLVDLPGLEDDPAQLQIDYRAGENTLVDRVLGGRTVIREALADLAQPWVSRAAAEATQRLLGLQAFVGIPMRVDGQTVGTIVAGVRQPPISVAHQRSLARIAEYAAVAIRKCLLYEGERSQAAELARANALAARLGRVATRIYAARTAERMLDILGAELKELHLACLVALPAADTGQLVSRYTSVGPGAQALAEKVIGLRLRDLADQEALFAPDLISTTAELLPHLPRSKLEGALQTAGLSDDVAALYVPLKAVERPIGVLAVWGPDLREADAGPFSIFARQVIVALGRVGYAP